MDSTTATRIAKSPKDSDLAKKIAKALKALVNLSQEEGFYDDLFLFRKKINTKIIDLPKEFLSILSDSKIIQFSYNGSKLSSNVMVHFDPHKGLGPSLESVSNIIIATDWPDIPPQKKTRILDGHEMVFPLHYESFAVLEQLARLIKRGKRFSSVLDIFCGSGVLGVYAFELGAKSVLFTDKHKRSLAFTRLNCLLNNISNCQAKISDTFNQIDKGEKFDLILANPPFEAIPDEDEYKYYYHSCGSRSGEFYVGSFLNQVTSYLRPNGVALTVNFLLSDLMGVKTKQRTRKYLKQYLDLAEVTAKLVIFDQVPLKDFWVRYDALDIDHNYTLLNSFLNNGISYLLLCTLQVSPNRKLRKINRFESPSFEKPSPPVPWWNPLKWPLPCGIRID